jgi:hypothetical protein
MPDSGKEQAQASQLDTLKGLLATALDLARNLAGDPLARRLLEVFNRFPADDREFVLGVLEREADSRLIGDHSSPSTGLSLRPNPNARLYVRVIEPEPPAEEDKIILASTRAIRMLHKVLEPMHERWHLAMRESLRHLTAEERAGAVRFCRDLLAMLED